MTTGTSISKKRKFVADGVFFAELNEVLTRELAEDGYFGVEKRFNYPKNGVELYAEKVNNRGLCAIAQLSLFDASFLVDLLSEGPAMEYCDLVLRVVRHVHLRQGGLGIKMKIMLAWDPKGKQVPMTPLPDLVTIHMPKDEEEYVRPHAVPRDIEVGPSE